MMRRARETQGLPPCRAAHEIQYPHGEYVRRAEPCVHAQSPARLEPSNMGEIVAMNAGLLEIFWIIIVIILFFVHPDTSRGRVLRVSTCAALVASIFARHFEFSDRDHVLLVIVVFVGTSYAAPQSNSPTVQPTAKNTLIALVGPNYWFAWISLLWIGVTAGLRYWSDVWLPTETANWLDHQNGLIKFAVYCTSGIVLYIAAFITVMKIVSPIHYAIDPAYETERAQKRQVKKFKIGDRIRVTDRKGEDLGTITRVIPTGEYFDVTWDDDGQKTTHSHFDVEDFEPC